LPDFNLDIDPLYPAYYDLNHECAYMLDKKHSPYEEVWVIKFTPSYKEPDSLMWIGTVTPDLKFTQNPELPKMRYDIDYNIPWNDLKYEHTWMLDDKHCVNAVEPIWAIKLRATKNVNSVKMMGMISPVPKVSINKELKHLNFGDIDYTVQYHDLGYTHVWMLDDNTDTWAVKVNYTNKPVGYKTIDYLTPYLDVIFISYHEPNAEQNWQRVLEKAPWAKRIDGVEGIFNAHRAAAKLSTTDLFFVVDGDAYLDDDWDFNYRPAIFDKDRDCAHVWASRNPVNDLVYQNGGVKLFPKKILLKHRTWNTLDMFAGIMPKTKAEDRISCTTTFNSDEFSTWRSAFREVVKLYVYNKILFLDAWMTKGEDRPFGTFAIQGARDGYNFAKENSNKFNVLTKINDYTWLQDKFRETQNSQ
jgi:hypothetical protein